jgi:hypothetical protein
VDVDTEIDGGVAEESSQRLSRVGEESVIKSVAMRHAQLMERAAGTNGLSGE